MTSQKRSKILEKEGFLNETLDELKRKIFGTFSEKARSSDTREEIPAEEKVSVVKGHARIRKKKSVRADLYEALPIKEIPCKVPTEKRLCPDCGSPIEHLGYKSVRKELRITPAKVERIHYMQETLVCRQEDEATIVKAKTPTPLLAHSPALPDMAAMVMYQKSFLHLPFYCQSKDWSENGGLSQEKQQHTGIITVP